MGQNIISRMIAVFFCLVVLIFATAADADSKPNLKKAGTLGDAYGYVLDAETHQYLSGARVSLFLPPDMEPVKDRKEATNSDGYYQIKAPLGKVTTRFATERLLDLSIGSILSGGARHVDNFINATQFVLTVSAPGYKTFTGTVPVESADPQNYRVRLCPMLLAPQGKSYISYRDPHMTLGRMDTVELSSVCLAPDEVVDYTVKCSNLPIKPHTQVSLWCFGSGGGLKEIKDGRPEHDHTYKGSFRIGKKDYTKPGLYFLTWFLENNNNELLATASASRIIAVGVDSTHKAALASLIAANPTPADLRSPNDPSHGEQVLQQMAALMPPGATLIMPSPKKGALKQTQTGQDDTATEATLKLEARTVGAGFAAKEALANFYYGHARFDEALPLYEALFQDPATQKLKSFYLFHNYAALLYRKGRQEEALSMFSRALDNARVNPQNTSLAASTTFVGSNMYTLYTGPARTAASGYAYPEASDDLIILENASSATPTQTTWMFAIALGHALDEIGLTETALPVLEKVVQEEPEQPEALLALAAAKYKSRNYAEASGLITRVLSVNPQNPDAAVLQTQTQEALRQMAPPVQEEARQTAKTQPPSVHNTPRPHRNKVPPLKNLKIKQH